ncbi:MAG: alpha/beta fold hydrolase [Rhodocyclaceae bacterium]|nr:alpha/beta fold hydrolase [Rhodocyclaceae bacterium]
MNTVPVLLPGWCLGRGPLQETAAACGARMVDLPGYNGTPCVETFDEAVERIAAQLPSDTPVCGWSLGAMLALAIAARHPQKVRRVALLAGTASFVQRAGWPHAMPPAMLAEFATAVATDAAAMLPRFVGGFNRGDARAKTVTARLLKLVDPLPAAEVLGVGLNWLRDADLRAEAPQVRAPVLLLHGENDPLMPAAAARALAEMLGQARVQVVPGCAHAGFLSQPDVFHAAMRAFLHDA